MNVSCVFPVCGDLNCIGVSGVLPYIALKSKPHLHPVPQTPLVSAGSGPSGVSWFGLCFFAV